MQHKKKKARAQKNHAKYRLSTRFGIDLNGQEYDDLVRLISGNKAEFVLRQSNRVSHWRVTVKGQTMIAVYDKIRKTVVTFLHEDPDDFVIPRYWG